MFNTYPFTSLNEFAAEVDNLDTKKLIFNNVTIETDPARCTGFYRISINGAHLPVISPQSFVFIPNLYTRVLASGQAGTLKASTDVVTPSSLNL